jgi:hypothetical protein
MSSYKTRARGNMSANKKATTSSHNNPKTTRRRRSPKSKPRTRKHKVSDSDSLDSKHDTGQHHTSHKRARRKCRRPLGSVQSECEMNPKKLMMTRMSRSLKRLSTRLCSRLLTTRRMKMKYSHHFCSVAWI